MGSPKGNTAPPHDVLLPPRPIPVRCPQRGIFCAPPTSGPEPVQELEAVGRADVLPVDHRTAVPLADGVHDLVHELKVGLSSEATFSGSEKKSESMSEKISDGTDGLV